MAEAGHREEDLEGLEDPVVEGLVVRLEVALGQELGLLEVGRRLVRLSVAEAVESEPCAGV